MPVVTVSRHAGAEGRYIAEKVSRALGYQLSDYKTVESILHEYGMVHFKDVYGSVPDFWDRFSTRGADREEVARMLGLVTLAEASRGNVVMLGRACFVSLQGFNDVINVRVKADLPVRINRIMRRYQLSFAEAEEFVKEKDRLVDGFIELYGASANNADAFDLVVDTGKISRDRAAEFVVESVCAIDSGTVGEARSTANIEIDEVLAGAVAAELQRESLR